MNRVTMFRETFPPNVYPTAQETHFIQKILDGSKKHTIRKGLRWKVGDMMLPRVWTGPPYRSKQRQFHDGLLIVKLWTIGIDCNGVISLGNFYIDDEIEARLRENDGLDEFEFWQWIIKPIYMQPGKYQDPWIGQVICWDESVTYDEHDT